MNLGNFYLKVHLIEKETKDKTNLMSNVKC